VSAASVMVLLVFLVCFSCAVGWGWAIWHVIKTHPYPPSYRRIFGQEEEDDDDRPNPHP